MKLFIFQPSKIGRDYVGVIMALAENLEQATENIINLKEEIENWELFQAIETPETKFTDGTDVYCNYHYL